MDSIQLCTLLPQIVAALFTIIGPGYTKGHIERSIPLELLTQSENQPDENLSPTGEQIKNLQQKQKDGLANSSRVTDITYLIFGIALVLADWFVFSLVKTLHFAHIPNSPIQETFWVASILVTAVFLVIFPFLFDTISRLANMDDYRLEIELLIKNKRLQKEGIIFALGPKSARGFRLCRIGLAIITVIVGYFISRY